MCSLEASELVLKDPRKTLSGGLLPLLIIIIIIIAISGRLGPEKVVRSEASHQRACC